MKKCNYINLGEKYIPIFLNGINIVEYSIVVRSDAEIAISEDTVEYKAARELQKYFALISGLSLNIIGHKCAFDKKYEILIGNTNRTINDVVYKDEEYEIKTDGSKLLFKGGKRGLIYGIYDFIEKRLGVLFLTDTIEKIHNCEKICVGKIDDKFCPVFEYREITFWNAFDSDYSVKSKINGNLIRHLDKNVGGSVGFVGGHDGNVHTFAKLLPPENYYESHPEYYAINKDGIIDVGGLCLSNESVVREVAKNAEKWLEEDENGVVSVSINDGGMAYCHCPKCKEITDREGSVSGNVIQFVNAVAEIIEKKYPKAKVETIIYGEVVFPPKTIITRDNVVLRICGPFMRSHTLLNYKNYENSKDLEALVITAKKIIAWGKICKSVYFWDYPAHYRCANGIFPHFHTILNNIKFYRNNNAKGIYINGNGPLSCQFSELSVYIISKCLYLPDMSDEEYNSLINNFLEAYYGGGWKHIRGFIDKTYELTKGKTFNAVSFPDKIIDIKNQQEFLSLDSYFQKAIDQSDNFAEIERIKMLRLQLEYHYLYSNMDRLYENGDEKTKTELVKRNKKLYENLKRYGILKLKENCYVPTIKDFRQSPFYWDYWDMECECGEMNTFNYDREFFVMIPVRTHVDKFDLEFELSTTNINSEMNLWAFTGNELSEIKSSENTDQKIIWDNCKNYKKMHVKNVAVTKLSDYTEKYGENIDDVKFRGVSKYKSGVLIRIKNISAGACVMIKNSHLID